LGSVVGYGGPLAAVTLALAVGVGDPHGGLDDFPLGQPGAPSPHGRRRAVAPHDGPAAGDRLD
jgi:hypothetical protein